MTMLNLLELVKISGNLLDFDILVDFWVYFYNRALLISDDAADCSYVIARPAIAAPPGHHL